MVAFAVRKTWRGRCRPAARASRSITQEQAGQRLADLEQRVPDRADAAFDDHGRGGDEVESSSPG